MPERTQVTSKGFPIVAPYIGTATLFKIYFGKKYLIWKGKSLMQSIDFIGMGIKSNQSKEVPIEHYLYHVVNHIKRTRVLSGRVEIIGNDYDIPPKGINGFQLLKDEQLALDDASEDELCLNNNVQAYIPINTSYISEKEKNKFLNWYEKRLTNGTNKK